MLKINRILLDLITSRVDDFLILRNKVYLSRTMVLEFLEA